MKKKIYVYSINPVNFIFCLILRLKYQIVYAKYENINFKLLFLFKDLNKLVSINHIKRNLIGNQLFFRGKHHFLCDLFTSVGGGTRHHGR